MVCISTNGGSSEMLLKIYLSKMFSDVTLVAGKDGKKIQAHKVVLVAALEYFELMFSGSFKETSDSEVKISDVDFDLLEAVIKFLYLGLVEIPDMETAIKLLEVSHLMKITALQDHVETYMLDNIAPDNCLGLISLARNYELKKLGLESANFAVRKFCDVIKEEEFKHLCKEDMIYYSMLLKNSIDVNVQAQAILDWILSDESRRNLSFLELLQLVDITSVKNKELVFKLHSTCIDSIDTKYKIDLIHQLHSKTTNNHETLLIVQNEADNKKSLSFYDIVKNEFVRKSKIVEKGEVVGVWDGKIIMINTEGDNKMVKIYNLQENVATIVGTYSYSTEQHRLTKIINGNLYIICKTFFLEIDLKTGAFKKTDSDGFAFESCEFLNHRLNFLAYKGSEGDTVWLTSIEDNWKIGASIKNYGTQIGSTVVHNQKMYYFDRCKVKRIPCTAEDDKWRYQAQLELANRPKVISIQNKVLLIKNNTIFEYSEGTLKPIESKLNLLNWESELSFFLVTDQISKVELYNQ